MRLLFRKILKSTSIKRLAITPRYRRSDELTDSPSSRLEQTLTKPKVFRPIIRPLLAKKQFQEERVFRPFIRPLLAKEQSQEERDCARGSGVIKSIAEKQHFAEKQTANIRAESSVARPLNRTASIVVSLSCTSHSLTAILIVAEKFQHHYQGAISNKSLDRVFKAAGLQDFVVPAVPSTTRSDPAYPRWTSSVVEAVIGGVYLDQGLDAAKTVARKLKIEAATIALTRSKTAQFDRMRNTVLTNEHFYAVGEKHCLQDYVQKAPGTPRVQKKNMSATVEAIVGAAYLDGGMEAAKTVAKNLDIDVLEEDTPQDSSHDVLEDPLQKLDLDASEDTPQAGNDKKELT
ncbi:MAG: hypothetical protein LQ350_004265 [Teloschistes chrysophthalmus]|nr:MAG: hypothetical protein LQ350_004265 [Niorma chrysophthalma]